MLSGVGDDNERTRLNADDDWGALRSRQVTVDSWPSLIKEPQNRREIESRGGKRKIIEGSAKFTQCLCMLNISKLPQIILNSTK